VQFPVHSEYTWPPNKWVATAEEEKPTEKMARKIRGRICLMEVLFLGEIYLNTRKEYPFFT
jgi:hypothetical protein